MKYTPPLATTPYHLDRDIARLLAVLRREVATGTVDHRGNSEDDANWMQKPTQLRLLEVQ